MIRTAVHTAADRYDTRYLYQEKESDEPVVMEHYQGIKIGYRWNNGKKVWLPTDYTKINTDPGRSALVKFDVTGTVLFSNQYIAPKVDQGF